MSCINALELSSMFLSIWHKFGVNVYGVLMHLSKCEDLNMKNMSRNVEMKMRCTCCTSDYYYLVLTYEIYIFYVHNEWIKKHMSKPGE